MKLCIFILTVLSLCSTIVCFADDPVVSPDNAADTATDNAADTATDNTADTAPDNAADTAAATAMAEKVMKDYFDSIYAFNRVSLLRLNASYARRKIAAAVKRTEYYALIAESGAAAAKESKLHENVKKAREAVKNTEKQLLIAREKEEFIWKTIYRAQTEQNELFLNRVHLSVAYRAFEEEKDDTLKNAMIPKITDASSKMEASIQSMHVDMEEIKQAVATAGDAAREALRQRGIARDASDAVRAVVGAVKIISPPEETEYHWQLWKECMAKDGTRTRITDGRDFRGKDKGHWGSKAADRALFLGLGVPSLAVLMIVLTLVLV